MRVVPKARLREMIRSVILSILVALSLVGFILSSWGKAEINDPESFSVGSSKALASPQVRSLLSEKITEEVWKRVDVKQEITNLLPEDAEILAAPAEVALRAALSSAVDNILKQEFVQSIWAESVRVTHNTALRSLQNRQSALLIEEESVSLDISTTLKITTRKLGLPSVIQDNIPSGIGEVELAKTQTVAEVQTAYNVLNVSPFLFLPPIIIFSLLLFVVERRTLWRAGIFLGASLLAAGMILLLLEAIIPPFFLGTFESPLSAALAQYIWREWSADLLFSVKLLLFLSLPLAGFSFLAAPQLRPLYKKMASDLKTWAGSAKESLESRWSENQKENQLEKKVVSKKPASKKSVSGRRAVSQKKTATKTGVKKNTTSRKSQGSKKESEKKAAPKKSSSGKKPRKSSRKSPGRASTRSSGRSRASERKKKEE